MTAFNVVRFRVEPWREQEVIDAHRRAKRKCAGLVVDRRAPRVLRAHRRIGGRSALARHGTIVRRRGPPSVPHHRLHPDRSPMTSPVRIAVALSSMNTGAWIEPLREACEQAGVAAQLLPFDGKPLDARYAVVWLPPPELFAVERGLRAVFNAGAGVERLLAMPSLPAGLPILRLVDAGMAPKMAEYACFFIARITRGLHRFGGPNAERDWNVDRPRGVPPTVGVLGLGAIGARIASAVAMFGYPVRGWSRTAKPLDGIDCFAGMQRLDEFLAGTNILVDALPLTGDTRDLLNRAHLSKLPAGSHLINVGRAGTIVDDDLLALLDSGHLAGAVLDVFRTEPLPAEHPFWRHPKVIVTPHLSGPTPREPAARQIAEAIAALEAGAASESLPGYVNRARGY
jgi:glyoxylate/hydroxypyruvate reductase A